MIEYGLIYVRDQRVYLQGYNDFDWVGIAIDTKKTSGLYFSLGSEMISWFSKKQTSVALSTTKDKYIATCLDFSDAVWLHKLLT